MKSTVITKHRNGPIIEMERLMLWVEDQNQRRILLSFTIIQEQAKRFSDALESKYREECEREQLVAIKGWFIQFKARANLNNFKVQSEAASNDEKTASNFPKALTEIIREGGLLC